MLSSFVGECGEAQRPCARLNLIEGALNPSLSHASGASLVIQQRRRRITSCQDASLGKMLLELHPTSRSVMPNNIDKFVEVEPFENPDRKLLPIGQPDLRS